MRHILHSDANCFYASVEAVLNPDLRDKAVAVCGSEEDRHGIVLAKSEKAKKAGVTTGMPCWQAREKCPDIIIVKPHFEYYSKFSKYLHEIYQRYTDYVEPFGLDECWLDVTKSLKKPIEIAEEIRQAVKDELGLTVSIGVSFNKVFAKLGSDLKKPDAITEISEENFKSKVWGLPCGDLLYCGRAMAEKLNRIGVKTIGQIAELSHEYMMKKFGKAGSDLWIYASGLDKSEVAHKDHYEPAKSVGHGITCVADIRRLDEAYKVIYALSQDIGYKLRAMKLKARGVSLGIKYKDLSYQGYQIKLENPTQDEGFIAKTACEMLKSKHDPMHIIRALTITAINLENENANEQISMFFDYESRDKREKLNKVLDLIKSEYGKDAIRPAIILDEDKMPKKEQGKVLPGKMHK
ncbi:MAG: DNA polymerase IV [Clostridia bacterium]|nr:DNA polymerase IV [Clostridia bacterium]